MLLPRSACGSSSRERHHHRRSASPSGSRQASWPGSSASEAGSCSCRRSSLSGSASSRLRGPLCSRSSRRLLAGTWNQRRYGNLRVRTALVVGRRVDPRRRGRREDRHRLPENAAPQALRHAAVRRRCAARVADAPRTARATLIRRDPPSRCRRRRGRRLSPRLGARLRLRHKAPTRQRPRSSCASPFPDRTRSRSASCSGQRARRRTFSRSSTRTTARSSASAVRARRSSPQTGTRRPLPVLRRGDRALAVRRRGRCGAGHGVGVGRRERALGRR